MVVFSHRDQVKLDRIIRPGSRLLSRAKETWGHVNEKGERLLQAQSQHRGKEIWADTHFSLKANTLKWANTRQELLDLRADLDQVTGTLDVPTRGKRPTGIQIHILRKTDSWQACRSPVLAPVSRHRNPPKKKQKGSGGKERLRERGREKIKSSYLRTPRRCHGRSRSTSDSSSHSPPPAYSRARIPKKVLYPYCRYHCEHVHNTDKCKNRREELELTDQAKDSQKEK